MNVGMRVGSLLGKLDGFRLGSADGREVGIVDGSLLGECDGFRVGNEDG